ncbi:MAG: hypothetical protein AAFZ58_03665 [Pseudomonadota bacterium]
MQVASAAFVLLAGDVGLADHRGTDNGVGAVVQQVADSRRLYQRALARQDAAMLAIAAELRAEALGTWQPTGDTDGGLPTPHDMLQQAKRWASIDDALSAVVEQIGRRRHRGNINGPLVRHVTIESGNPLNLNTAFTPKFPAVVYLEGVPDVRFALRVLDSEGTPVCEDASAKTYKLCRFLPDRTEPYVVTATSRETAPIELLLITN